MAPAKSTKKMILSHNQASARIFPLYAKTTGFEPYTEYDAKEEEMVAKARPVPVFKEDSAQTIYIPAHVEGVQFGATVITAEQYTQLTKLHPDFEEAFLKDNPHDQTKPFTLEKSPTQDRIEYIEKQTATRLASLNGGTTAPLF